MTRRLALFLAALGLASLARIDTADAGRFRFSGSGRVHARVSGGVSVGWARPVYQSRGWGVGGHIYVGPRYGYYYPRSYYYPRYYYYYEPVPSYYGYYSTQSYYPVQPTPAVTAAVAPQRPDLPRFGMGLFAGGVSVEGQDDSSDYGLLARFRLTPGLILEGELGKTSYENDLRVDRRLGASLQYEFGAYNALAPYVLAGFGVQQADVGDGEFQSTQNFGELGIGLRWALSPHFNLLFDIRAGSRNTVSDSVENVPTDGVSARSVTPPSEASGDNEGYTRGRLAAVLYF